MDKFKVYIKNAAEEIEVDSKTSLLDISKDYRKYMKGDILTARVNNDLKDLNTRISSDCTVEFYDITDSNGFSTYQRSVSLLMFAAAYYILDPNSTIWVEHTINKNYYSF